MSCRWGNKVTQCALPHELLAICTHLPVRLQWLSAFCIAAAKFPLPKVVGLVVAMELTVIHELVQIICREGTLVCILLCMLDMLAETY